MRAGSAMLPGRRNMPPEAERLAIRHSTTKCPSASMTLPERSRVRLRQPSRLSP
jgi:hypothetical protein